MKRMIEDFLIDARIYVKTHPEKVLLWGALVLAFVLGYALG